MHVRLTISGRNYHAIGAVTPQVELPDGCSLDQAIQTVRALLPSGVTLPESCLVAVSGKHLGSLSSHRAHALAEGDELLLIAPVAGG